MKAAKLTLRLGLGAIAFIGASASTRWPESNRKVLAFHKPYQYPNEPVFKWNSNWDRRDPKGYVDPPKVETAKEVHQYHDKVKDATPTATRHIMLVRHGQYLEQATQDKDRLLTSLGRSQADMTGQRLKQLALPFKNVTASTMARAQETARLIHAHVPHLEFTSDPCLSEGAPTQPEPISANWKPTPDQFFQDGARIENAFRKYFHRADPGQMDDTYELIVCHSNVIRYFLCRALQFPVEGWIRVSVANCSMTLLTIHPDGTVVMEMMGDHGHIPPESVTFH